MTTLMTIILLAVLFVAIPVLAPWLGTDSRDLRDHDWEVSWDRMPRDGT